MEKVISVVNLKKVYKLYEKPIYRLKESLNITGKKYHKEHYALNNINFDVFKGETIGLIGKNGSGKSTLLKIITGVLYPTTGEISSHGRISALLELGAGFNPEFTGLENIYLQGTMMGYPSDEMQGKLQSIIDFADIGDFINQPVKTYSSGMFARLAFSVAINVDPDILIVDEALSVGDIFFQSKCYNKFEEFAEKGKTILFVSHDMGSIIKYCNRSILLHEGEFIAEGPSKEMVDLYKKIVSDSYYKDVKQEDITSVDDYNNAEWINRIPNKNPNHVEYGNKKAEIYDYGVFNLDDQIVTNVVKNQLFQIKLRVKFAVEVQSPIFAYTIKDVKGNDLTGTNTLFESVNTGSAIEGSIYEISFEQKLPLQNGEYLISLGCTGYELGELQIYHRLYDVLNLIVISEKNTVGFFDVNSSVELKKLK
ncbi:ABC transporter ATP-binding protein [Paenibacillus sp. CMAA1364]